jgi:hypothetical protein
MTEKVYKALDGEAWLDDVIINFRTKYYPPDESTDFASVILESLPLDTPIKIAGTYDLPLMIKHPYLLLNRIHD